MAQENEHVQEEVVEQEEQQAEEIVFEDDQEETVSIPKSQFNKMKRKALAYDANPKKTVKEIIKTESQPYNILEDEVADLILGGYDKEETRFILANGGRKALENKESFVSVAINAKRDQRRTEEAVSQTSNKGYVVQGGKSYSEEQLRNMSPEEMLKVLPHA
jgi:excinuclease UvrABC ATPase subunit